MDNSLWGILGVGDGSSAVLLITFLCCAWEHSDNIHGDRPGLADGQGIAAVPALLYWAGWNSSVNSSQGDCDSWICPWRVDVLHPKVSVDVGMFLLQQMLGEASLAIDKAMIGQLKVSGSMNKSTPQQALSEGVVAHG
ncbi:hypothetical protein BTVI_154782 [Pitangus sulphuratus]|nr:hypothetical protein BTVI_154782 [Pitangus sulphuratus]